jgi:hypothetical protein
LRQPYQGFHAGFGTGFITLQSALGDAAASSQGIAGSELAYQLSKACREVIGHVWNLYHEISYFDLHLIFVLV